MWINKKTLGKKVDKLLQRKGVMKQAMEMKDTLIDAQRLKWVNTELIEMLRSCHRVMWHKGIKTYSYEWDGKWNTIDLKEADKDLTEIVEKDYAYKTI